MPAPIVLDPPPAYLADLPDFVLRPGNGSSDLILDGLRRRGIYARPRLAEVEAERARRGRRRGLVVSPEPAPARVVLPMGPGRTARQEPGEVSEEARHNRERVEAVLGGSAVRTQRDRRVAPLGKVSPRVRARLADGNWHARSVLISLGANAAERSAIHRVLVGLVAEGHVEERPSAEDDAHGEFRLVQEAA